jgi:kumamolisin
VEAFAAEHGLTVEESSIPRRTVVLAGTVAQLSAAFAVDLRRYRAGEVSYRGYDGPVHLPASLIPIVDGVLGLDNRPQGRPFLRFAPATSAPSAQPDSLSFTPVNVANFYDFPAGADATDQCIGLLEIGGGFHRADIRAWFTALGQPEPGVVEVSIDGARNSPGDSPADAEPIADIDVAGAVAPGARIAVYFAPNNEQARHVRRGQHRYLRRRQRPVGPEHLLGRDGGKLLERRDGPDQRDVPRGSAARDHGAGLVRR